MTDIPARRNYDQRLQTLSDDLETIRQQLTANSLELAANTAITKQVADVLASFRVLAALSKWLTVIAGGVASIFALGEFWKR